MGTPSSGENPIVVSTERPPRTAVTDDAASEVTHDQAQIGPFIAHELGHTLGAPLHRKPVKTVAPDAPVLAPRSGNRVRRSLSRHARVERGVEDRHVRVRRKELAGVIDGAESRRVVERRDLCGVLDRLAQHVVDQRRLDELSPAVHDPMADGANLIATNGLEGIHRLDCVVLVNEVQLETRRSCVDDENRLHASERPGPVADVRVVVAVRARVRASFEASVLHCLPEVGGVCGEPRHAIDDVDDQMEAIEIVEHDHVERRRRRPFFLVSAHVEVAMVRAPIREAMYEPRIAVVREDDGPVFGEERVERGIGQPVRMLASRAGAA